jgi:hypothetical protein
MNYSRKLPRSAVWEGSKTMVTALCGGRGGRRARRRSGSFRTAERYRTGKECL